MSKTNQISVRNFTQIIDHMNHLRNQLMNVQSAPGIKETTKFHIFRCVSELKAIEEELILERNELPLPNSEVLNNISYMRKGAKS